MNTLNSTLSISLVAVATLGLSAPAEARSSSESELRGYTTCVGYAQERSNGLVPEREYLIDKSASTTQYFVNATRWEQGERNAIRVACETTRRGHDLVSATINDGRYTTKTPTVTVEVAAN